MEKLRIPGEQKLVGKIKISGAKNSALPLCAAGLLPNGYLKLNNVPNLSDICIMKTLLQNLGCSVESQEESYDSFSMKISPNSVNNFVAKYDLVKQMRASILILGPLLARFGTCSVSMPGGCSIGVRPIDLHLRGLEALGATISLENGYITATAKNGLVGNKFIFPIVTVTGTENVLMAATLAKGTTVLMNVACEPEIVDLAECLNKMGAKISGHGTPTITVEGIDELHSAEHTVISDRIEAGTYAMAAGITNGKVELIGKDLFNMLSSPLAILSRAGMTFEQTANGFIASGNDKLEPVNVETKEYPGFPTDLQAQLMALLCAAEGTSVITESIWENRFMHVPELCRMGADITVCGSSAVIKKAQQLCGAQVMATDLRASFCLIIAALAAKGETILDKIYHLDRGYSCVEKKLAACGVTVERILQ